MTYSFVIKSQDKISGTNNSGTYYLNFRILPREIKYWRLTFYFYTAPSYYKDTIAANHTITYSASNGYITTNLTTSLSAETTGSPSNILGFWTKQMNPTNISAHPYLTYLYSGIENTSVPITIMRPYNENININIYNLLNNELLVDTDNTGNVLDDCSNWIIGLNLEPVLNVDKE
jgi:hypothetical protein